MIRSIQQASYRFFTVVPGREALLCKVFVNRQQLVASIQALAELQRVEENQRTLITVLRNNNIIHPDRCPSQTDIANLSANNFSLTITISQLEKALTELKRECSLNLTFERQKNEILLHPVSRLANAIARDSLDIPTLILTEIENFNSFGRGLPTRGAVCAALKKKKIPEDLCFANIETMISSKTICERKIVSPESKNIQNLDSVLITPELREKLIRERLIADIFVDDSRTVEVVLEPKTNLDNISFVSRFFKKDEGFSYFLNEFLASLPQDCLAEVHLAGNKKAYCFEKNLADLIETGTIIPATSEKNEPMYVYAQDSGFFQAEIFSHNIGRLIQGLTLPPGDKAMITQASGATVAYYRSLKVKSSTFFDDCFAVARTVAEFDSSARTICAALLYRVPFSRIPKSLPQTQKILGNFARVCHLPFYHRTENSYYLRNFMHKIFKEIKSGTVMLILWAYKLREIEKLCERGAQPSDMNFIRSIRHIYAPIAERFGLLDLGDQLRDFAFRAENPVLHAEILKERNRHYHGLDRSSSYLYLREIGSNILRGLKQLPIISEVHFEVRFKSPYAIYRKMMEKGEKYRTVSDFRDILGISMILKINGREHYGDDSEKPRIFDEAMALIELQKEKFGFISTDPDQSEIHKKRGFHIGVVDKKGRPIEIQFLTGEEDFNDKWGYFAHWIYKLTRETGQRFDSSVTIRPSGNFLQDFDCILQLLADRVYPSFFRKTSKNLEILDILELPAEKTTPADFAHITGHLDSDYCGAEVAQLNYDEAGNLLPPKYISVSENYQFKDQDNIRLKKKRPSMPHYLTAIKIRDIKGQTSRTETFKVLDDMLSEKK